MSFGDAGRQSTKDSATNMRSPTRPRSATAALLLLAAMTVWYGCRESTTAKHLAAKKSVGVQAAAKQSAQPNVVLILVDTVRADRLSAYGYGRDTTPFLKTYASTGVKFTSAYAQGLWTRTSVPSLLTSSYVTGHANVSIVPPIDQLPACYPDLPETLSGAGYNTAAFTGPILPGSYYSDFGWYRGFRYMAGDWYLHHIVASAGTDPRVLRQIDLNTVRSFGEWLGQRPAGPFFAYLHLMGAHGPYETAPEYEAPFIPAATSDSFIARFKHSYGWDKARAAKHPDELKYIRDAYDSAVRFTDDNIRTVINGLSTMGLSDSTIVVILADHGENLLEEGITTAWQHGIDNPPRQPITHIPMILTGPGVPRGVIIHEPVMLIDVAPTILQMTGTPIPPQMRGINMLGTAALHRRSLAFSESDFAYRVRSAVGGRWKYVRIFPDFRVPEYAAAHYGGETLYDLSADPGERADVAFQHPGELLNFRKALDQQLIRGQSGWHVRVQGNGAPSNYELRIRAAEPLSRLSVEYAGSEPLDFDQLLRTSLFNDATGAGVVINHPVAFEADPARKITSRSVVAFGVWARVTGGSTGVEVSLATGEGPPLATATARGQQPEWTPVWAYALVESGIPRLMVRPLDGKGRVEIRHPFAGVPSDFFDFERVKQETEITVPIAVTSGAIDVNFDAAASGSRIEVSLLQKGNLVADTRMHLLTRRPARNPLRISPTEAFVTPAALVEQNFRPGAATIYYSGCCPGRERIDDEKINSETRKRLRSLGYLH